MAIRQVRGVFVNYKVEVDGPNGQKVAGMRTANRGATIETDTLAPGQLDRLERLGMLMAPGGEVPADRIEEVLARALNPLDVVREDAGPPVSVAAPSMGQAPRGDFTAGDTGVDPALNPDSPITGLTSTTMTEGEVQAALDAARELASRGDQRTDAPDVEDTGALAEFITAERLNATDTVALAENDPDRARYVLEAERTATGQDPRKSVAEPLQKIIDGGSGA